MLSPVLLILSACAADSPALGSGRASFVTTQVQGHTFRIYTESTRNCVEIHRVNMVFPPPSRREILITSEIAAEQVTGCKIKKGTFIGDQAMQKGQLDCSDGPGAKDWVAGTCNFAPWWSG